MKVIGKDRTSCDVCNPIDEIIARLDALERRASAIVAKVQGIAPDGEGNVTLPTSSSDTDPLHGRVDAFAMSSEVKEAADDAHAYAASIADDVLVINSEIDALNQAVEALQPAEIEAIKAAVQTLQTTVATLESTVATLNNSVAGKVSKSGDTMTGPLTAPKVDIKSNLMASSEIPSENQFLDNSSIDRYGAEMTLDRLFRGSNGDIIKQLGIRDRSGNFHWINLLAVTDGGDYAVAPSWSVGTNDNSNKVMTIKMANSLPSLVHTTGIEVINGLKKFTNTQWGGGGVAFKDPRYGITNSDNPLYNGKFKFISQVPLFDANEAIISNDIVQTNADNSIERVAVMRDSTNTQRTIYSIKLNPSNGGIVMKLGSNTPSNATGMEIATANWVITKINEMATKNKLTGL